MPMTQHRCLMGMMIRLRRNGGVIRGRLGVNTRRVSGVAILARKHRYYFVVWYDIG